MRTLNPPGYTNYRDYKPHLKDEFDRRCVYCRKADIDQDPGSFHVDHYRPKDKFPDLINVYTNLFYACASCNRFKSNYWSDNKSEQVLNPCDHIMSQHLVFEMESVTTRSPQGELSIDILRLNNNESVLYRKNTIEKTLLLIKFILSIRVTKIKTERDWIDRAVMMLAKLTPHSEEKIRNVLQV